MSSMKTFQAAQPAAFSSSRRQTQRPSSRPRRSVAAQSELQTGSKLSDFPNYYKVLNNQDGEAVTLSSYAGKNPLVLFFYPKAGSPGCTAQACSFRDAFERFTKAGAKVFGISGDKPSELKKFKEDQNLQYDLLSDENNILRKTFGIKNALFVLPGRQTYVINKNGECIMSFNDMTNTSQHITEALQALGI